MRPPRGFGKRAPKRRIPFEQLLEAHTRISQGESTVEEEARHFRVWPRALRDRFLRHNLEAPKTPKERSCGGGSNQETVEELDNSTRRQIDAAIARDRSFVRQRDFLRGRRREELRDAVQRR